MAYNHGLAEKIFKEEWEKKKAYYRANGMSESQIADMYALERDIFNSDRTFYEGTVPLFDNEESQTLETNDLYIEVVVRDWPDLLGDMEKYDMIMAMPEEMRIAYGLHRLGGYTQKQISSFLLIDQSTAGRWIGKIAEIVE